MRACRIHAPHLERHVKVRLALEIYEAEHAEKSFTAETRESRGGRAERIDSSLSLRPLCALSSLGGEFSTCLSLNLKLNYSTAERLDDTSSLPLYTQSKHAGRSEFRCLI